MRIELTKQQCKWLAELVKKDRLENERSNRETPHPLFELRRDNMVDLENKLNTAIERQIKREDGAR